MEDFGKLLTTIQKLCQANKSAEDLRMNLSRIHCKIGELLKRKAALFKEYVSFANLS